jgi:two-component system, cell cycle sensor histidine kinase and response regulator CckA
VPRGVEDWLRNPIFLGKRENSEKNHKGALNLETSETTPVSNLRVFIVEDERLIAENLKIIIEDQNWQVIGIVSSGEDAIKIAEATNPDLILMDVRIRGDVDGVHAALVIHESLRRKPRILFLSAHPQEQFPHLDSLPAESFAYLKKPYTPEDLVAAIETLFS